MHLRDPQVVDFRAKYEKVAGPSGGALDKMGLNAFSTLKRHPFIWCCDNCLHKGFTRTYVIKYCFLKEIIYCVLIGIIASAAAHPAGGVPFFIVALFLVMLQIR